MSQLCNVTSGTYKIFPAEDTGLSLDDYEMSMVNVVFYKTKFPTLVWVASFFIKF